jgi:hypothetical protein
MPPRGFQRKCPRATSGCSTASTGVATVPPTLALFRSRATPSGHAPHAPAAARHPPCPRAPLRAVTGSPARPRGLHPPSSDYSGDVTGPEAHSFRPATPNYFISGARNDPVMTPSAACPVTMTVTVTATARQANRTVSTAPGSAGGGLAGGCWEAGELRQRRKEWFKAVRAERDGDLRDVRGP